MDLSELLAKKQGIICDMDGVIYHGNRLLPGVREFLEWIRKTDKSFLFLTNSSERTPRELREKLARLGLDVGLEHFYTSALATAAFLSSQHPGGTAYVIGGNGLINALYEAGFAMNDVNPDYVVVGETLSYTYDTITQAINLVEKGARLIGTNPDLTGPGERGIVPATGAIISPIELATGRRAYFVGKPNPLMMRQGLKRLGCRREDAIIVGDRMDTDIVAGIESEIDTILVLTGVTSLEEISRFPYRPRFVLGGVADMPTGQIIDQIPVAEGSGTA
ncbi:HAD-IIA family hydrolase [Salinispira pacifica]